MKGTEHDSLFKSVIATVVCIVLREFNVRRVKFRLIPIRRVFRSFTWRFHIHYTTSDCWSADFGISTLWMHQNELKFFAHNPLSIIISFARSPGISPGVGNNSGVINLHLSVLDADLWNLSLRRKSISCWNFWLKATLSRWNRKKELH